MQDFAAASERATKNDEPVSYEGIHESRVLIPAVLFAKIERPVPWTTVLEANRVEHDGYLTPSVPLRARTATKRSALSSHGAESRANAVLGRA